MSLYEIENNTMQNRNRYVLKRPQLMRTKYNIYEKQFHFLSHFDLLQTSLFHIIKDVSKTVSLSMCSLKFMIKCLSLFLMYVYND